MKKKYFTEEEIRIAESEAQRNRKSILYADPIKHEEWKAKRRAYRLKNKDRVNENYRRYMLKHPRDPAKRKITNTKWLNNNLEKAREIGSRIARRYKEACVNMYSNGDACCTRCKIADMDVLCLDHIENDGSEHRRLLKASGEASSFYRYLSKHDYPSGFQVLCYNCNMKKLREFERSNGRRFAA